MLSRPSPTLSSFPEWPYGAQPKIFFIGAVLAGFGFSAAAADKTNRTETLDQKGYQIQKIIVTAQKREESFQDVPISITSFSGQQMEEARIEDTLDLVKQVPNV